MALKKLCAKCGKIVDYGNRYCDRCQVIADKMKKDQSKNYNRNNRDKESQSFYNSSAWKAIVSVVKARDKGLCLYCLSKNKLSYYNVIHHIEELKDNKDKSLDIDNLISLCHSCHAKIHVEYKTKNKFELQNKLRELVGGCQKVL